MKMYIYIVLIVFFFFNPLKIFADKNDNFSQNESPCPELLLLFSSLGTTIHAGDETDFNFTYNQGSGNSQVFNTFIWNFGDPSSSDNTSTLQTPSHLYAATGVYLVTLTASVVYNNEVSCEETIRMYIQVECALLKNIQSVQGAFINPGDVANFSLEVAPGLGALAAFNSFLWNFDDPQSSDNTSTLAAPQHMYLLPGDYMITLTASVVINGVTFCEQSLTYTLHVIICPTIGINATEAPGFCLGTTETFTAFFQECLPDPCPWAITGYLWDFGDGNTSTNAQPAHNYVSAGSYTISLTTNFGYIGELDKITCQSTETLNLFVFSFDCSLSVSNNNPMPNEDVYFLYNGSVDGYYCNFNFDYGDGSSVITGNLNNIQQLLSNNPHSYPNNQSYTATLTIDCPTGPGPSIRTCHDVCSIPVFVGPGNTCESCIQSFQPIQGDKYVISAWVKETGGNSAIATTYSNAQLILHFQDLSFQDVAPPVTLLASGQIIDGWQRIENEFQIPLATEKLGIELKNIGSGTDVFFDDIRVFPFKANMKSFVYDQVTLKLVAELDENNYATFYEYDEEGKLIRVKKETIRGIATIKESRNNTSKHP